MGLYAAVQNRVSFFNIFYFKFIDIVVEIVGPDSYGCKRIKVDNFKLIKQPKINDKLIDKIEIPLKFVVKKQLVEISYIPIRAGIHKISIVHQGNNILNSPYIVKIDGCN